MDRNRFVITGAMILGAMISSLGCQQEQVKPIPRQAQRGTPKALVMDIGIAEPEQFSPRRFSRTENLDFRDQLEALPGIEVKTNDEGRVVFVDFRKAGGGSYDALVWFYGLPFVETIILSGEHVDNRMVFAIAGHPNLKTLNIAQRSSVDGEVWPALVAMKNLEDLSLEGSRISDEKLEELTKISTLRKLRLRGTSVTAEGIKKLASLTELEVLDLRDCPSIGDVGLQVIGSFAKLKSLLVNGEGVSDSGFASLRSLANLQLLVLPRSNVTDEGLGALRDLKKLKELDLFQASISDAGLRNLSDAKELSKLKIRGTKITSAGLEVIVGLSKLAELDLSETAVDDLALEFIVQCPSLVDINFLRTGITAAGIEKLSGMKLKRLNLDDVRGVSDACLPSLAKIESLEFLHLGKTSVSDAGVSSLAQLKGLKTLILENTQVSAAKIEELKKTLPETDIKYASEGAAAG